ncbi:hypothetical protein DCS_02929 [Drechmeria coniospora]|uniref:Uncharacterized protein n=1 Tax=Drechmeria coniospora TaxID=98403 RepID=A0A151GXE8_DRECN|nr:hypothetical protein DCS_02929 [Drechmeria coniospora]KYK61785.1 hypothetical protein DCS_02929 [Drechmeria coniospora]
MAPSGTVQTGIIYQALIQSNCHAFLGGNVEVDVISQLDAAAYRWKVHVIKTEDGFRTIVLSASAPTLQRAFEDLHRKSAQAVGEYVLRKGFDPLPGKPTDERDGPERDISTLGFASPMGMKVARHCSPDSHFESPKSWSSSDSEGDSDSLHMSSSWSPDYFEAYRPPVMTNEPLSRHEILAGGGADGSLPSPGLPPRLDAAPRPPRGVVGPPPKARHWPTTLRQMGGTAEGNMAHASPPLPLPGMLCTGGPAHKATPVVDVWLPAPAPTTTTATDTCKPSAFKASIDGGRGVMLTIDWEDHGEATFLEHCDLEAEAIKAKVLHLLATRRLAFGSSSASARPSPTAVEKVKVKQIKMDGSLYHVGCDMQDELSMLLASEPAARVIQVFVKVDACASPVNE